MDADVVLGFRGRSAADLGVGCLGLSDERRASRMEGLERMVEHSIVSVLRSFAAVFLLEAG